MKEVTAATVEETEEIELVDIEEYSKGGRQVPANARSYRFRVDKEHFTTQKVHLTGREILTLSNNLPPERFNLRQRNQGGQVKPVGLDDTVNLAEPGIERFTTIPKDQTEGS